MKGFIAAVAFATILAVVVGPDAVGRQRASATISTPACSARQGRRSARRCGSRASPRSCSASSRSLLGIVFEKINVAFMVGLAFAVAASANFPVLLLSMLWKGLTTRGAVIGGFVGLVSAVGLDDRQPRRSGRRCSAIPRARAWFPYVSPALFTMPLAFLCCWCSRSPTSPPGPRGAGGVRSAVCRARRPASASKAPPRTEAATAPRPRRGAAALQSDSAPRARPAPMAPASRSTSSEPVADQDHGHREAVAQALHQRPAVRRAAAASMRRQRLVEQQRARARSSARGQWRRAASRRPRGRPAGGRAGAPIPSMRDDFVEADRAPQVAIARHSADSPTLE